jgi:hypothetical protein
MSSVSANWPFEKLSTYLLVRILEGYCPDRDRVHQALRILDGQDAVGTPVEFDPCEWPAWSDNASHNQPEPFSPDEDDLRWAAMAFDLPDSGLTDEDWEDYARHRAMEECLEAYHRVTDEDIAIVTGCAG